MGTKATARDLASWDGFAVVGAALEEGAAEVSEVDAVEEPTADDEQPLTVSPITTAAAPAAVRVTVTLTPVSSPRENRHSPFHPDG